MRWLPIHALLLLPVVLCSGCTSDDLEGLINQFTPPQGLLDEASCMGYGLEDGRTVVNGLFAVYEQIQDGPFVVSPPNEVSYDLESEPNTFDVLWDVDGDGSVTESHLFGELYPSENLNNGFSVGESADADWALEVSSVRTGEGTFSVTRSGETTVNIQGSGSFLSNGCSFEIVAMDLTLDETSFPDGTPEGFIRFATEGGAMTGTFTFDPILEVAHVAVTYDGTDYNFDFDLDTWEPIFN